MKLGRLNEKYEIYVEAKGMRKRCIVLSVFEAEGVDLALLQSEDEEWFTVVYFVRKSEWVEFEKITDEEEWELAQAESDYEMHVLFGGQYETKVFTIDGKKVKMKVETDEVEYIVPDKVESIIHPLD